MHKKGRGAIGKYMRGPLEEFLSFGKRSATETRGLNAIEELLAHRFKQRSLLRHALMHSSRAHETGSDTEHNERLEFLGDAVLQLVITEELYSSLPDAGEGLLSKIRASLVNKEHLAQLARELNLTDYLLLGKSLQFDPNRFKRPALLANGYEAILGAVYLDGGFETAKRVILKQFGKSLHRVIETRQPLFEDSKTTLQELTMRIYGVAPSYELLDEDEESEGARFTVSVSVADRSNLGRGTGRTKKEAEQEAASEALSILNAERAGEQARTGQP